MIGNYAAAKSIGKRRWIICGWRRCFVDSGLFLFIYNFLFMAHVKKFVIDEGEWIPFDVMVDNLEDCFQCLTRAQVKKYIAQNYQIEELEIEEDSEPEPIDDYLF